MWRFSGQVVIQEMVEPPYLTNSSLASSGCDVLVANLRLLRLGTRKALRPRSNTIRNARYRTALAATSAIPSTSTSAGATNSATITIASPATTSTSGSTHNTTDTHHAQR